MLFAYCIFLYAASHICFSFRPYDILHIVSFDIYQLLFSLSSFLLPKFFFVSSKLSHCSFEIYLFLVSRLRFFDNQLFILFFNSYVSSCNCPVFFIQFLLAKTYRYYFAFCYPFSFFMLPFVYFCLNTVSLRSTYVFKTYCTFF
jgi:hypothetical protein